MFAGVLRKEGVHERSISGEGGCLGSLMRKMPGIVLSRLGRIQAEGSIPHPDANLLAAFAEHALLERERATVAAHLADCPGCREYLALAFGAVEEESGVVRRPGATWWREWRWVASAAAACCVVAVALEFNPQPPSRVNTKEVARSVAALEEPKATPLGALQTKTKSVSAGGQKPSPALKFEARKLAALDPKVAADQLLTQTPPPTAPEAHAYSNPPAETVLMAHGDTPNAVSRFAAEDSTKAPAILAPPAPSLETTMAAPRSSGSGFMAGVPLRGAMRKKAAIKSVVLESQHVIWSINASPDKSGDSRGVVQRSTDGGQSWRTVPLSENVSFRAVAAAGRDVWAGGSGGTLFHSSDGGAHWTSVSDFGISGDIIRIDVRGEAEVQVVTSAGEDWRSADGGQHWNRQ